jgi:hypothetical protein
LCIYLFDDGRQEVESTEDSGGGGADDEGATCVELDEGLQDDLCQLWDMSMNQVNIVKLTYINTAVLRKNAVSVESNILREA